MDCHDFASAKSRNDGNHVFDTTPQAAGFCVFYPNAASKKADSRSEAQNLKTPAKDSRICDEKPLLFKPRKEDKTSGLSTQCGAEIKGLSRKAESPQAQKPMPKPQRLAL
ncbi:hypothetical protein HMPREF2087_00502 [Helicobacter canis NCTC 12740]|uniref:Uncharacterized protein n=2 Tax=Helicobacter canis TaxID=29419 RepID=V8CJR2_9HELI|nr:hypothetical protein HMPREF2087_00502 [Helicobacter canis NCTC 12740]